MNKKYLGLIAAGLLSLGIGSGNLEARADDYFLEGIVKGEKYASRPSSSDYYVFTLDTTNGIKTITCYGEPEAAKLDALIDKGDKITLWLVDSDLDNRQQKPTDKEYTIHRNQVLSVNGKSTGLNDSKK